ncbi:MAG: radical SAM protein [Pseudomonadota bacterium]
MADDRVIDLTIKYPNLMNAPKSVDLCLTGHCNLKCSYCFYADSMQDKKDLNTEQWKATIKELGEIGVQDVCLSGGEVFVRKDFWELLDSVIENRMRYSILSNGTLITEKTIEEFGKGKRRLRMNSIQVSIDGSCAEIHNKSRPHDSFDKALNGLKLLVKNKFPATCRCTINHHNYHDLENVGKLLLEEVGLSSFSTNEAEQMGTARCNGQDVVLSVEQRTRAMNDLMNLNEKYKGRIQAQAGPLTRAKGFKEMEALIEKGELKIPGRGNLVSCGGVFSKMAILHDGTMVPCNMLHTLSMGTVGINSIKEAWQRHPSINVVRDRRKISLREFEQCKDCEYVEMCTGGCPASIAARFDKLNEIDPLSCYKEYLKEKKL